MLKINNLQFEYPEQKLFQPINLHIQPGSCLQLIGPNGVGKTTVLNILAGLCQPRRGRIVWQNKTVTSLAPFAKYLGHNAALKNQLTVLENLNYYQNIVHAAAQTVEQACAFFDLTALKSQWVQTLSAGQKHRCQLAKLMIGDAPIWLLDEPCTALDQTHINQLIKLFQCFLAQGGIIIFTSHQALPTEQFVVQTLEIKPYES
jgi:heme exporter protein A